jgi:hypothetical protein
MNKLLLSVLFLLLCQLTFGQSDVKIPVDCDNGIKFHYLIADNVTTKKRKLSERFREIVVFLDEKAFSEESLKTLFTHLSKKYSSPNILNIRVETNWERVPNPDDCEGSGTSGEPDRKDIDDFHWALFLRRGKNEIFRYNPVLKKTDIKTIVMKGRYF